MDEKKFWVGLAIGLLAWFLYLYPAMKDWIIGNYIMAFFIITGIYLFIALKYVFNIDPIGNPKSFLAFFLIWWALDLLMPPYLVNMQGPISSDPTIFTSDVVTYRLWGQAGSIGYYLTFIVTPLLLLFVTRRLLSKQSFFAKVKERV